MLPFLPLNFFANSLVKIAGALRFTFICFKKLFSEKYFKISSKYNINFAQMSLKFCEIQKFVTSVIIGATTMEQLKTNVESVNVNLSDNVIKEINHVQKIYPNPCP